MKHASVLLLCFFITACKVEDQPAADNESPPPAHQNMLQSSGCSVSKSHGVFTVLCADGSSATSGTPSAHIKDGNGADIPNLTFVGNGIANYQLFRNTVSGNVLAFNAAGAIAAVALIYFDGPNCTGNAFTSALGGSFLKNQVFASNSAWPGGAQAIRTVGFAPVPPTMQSHFTAGACTNAVVSAGLANLFNVVQTTFDATDPQSLVLPVELVTE